MFPVNLTSHIVSYLGYHYRFKRMERAPIALVVVFPLLRGDVTRGTAYCCLGKKRKLRITAGELKNELWDVTIITIYQKKVAARLKKSVLHKTSFVCPAFNKLLSRQFTLVVCRVWIEIEPMTTTLPCSFRMRIDSIYRLIVDVYGVRLAVPTVTKIIWKEINLRFSVS